MYNAPVSSPVDATNVIGRRIGAFLVNAVILVVTVIGAARGIADFKREDIPPSLQRQLDAQDVSVCDLIENENSISLCFNSNDTVFYATGKNAAAAVFGLPLAVSFVNSVLLAAIAGGSLGKLLFGLRVVKRSTGQKAGFGGHLVRWLLWIVDAQPCGLPLVGLVTGLATKGHRRVGDMAAGTLVVSKSSVGLPMTAVAAPAAPGGWAPPPAPGGYGAPPAAPGAWAPPAPAADPWNPPAPAAPAPGAWAPPAAPTAPANDTWPPSPSPAAPAPWAAPEAAAPAADPAPVWAAPAAPEPVAPAPEPEPEPTQVVPQPDAAATTGPQWDAARNAYIQWEPVSGQWMQFDDAAQEWRPLT